MCPSNVFSASDISDTGIIPLTVFADGLGQELGAVFDPAAAAIAAPAAAAPDMPVSSPLLPLTSALLLFCCDSRAHSSMACCGKRTKKTAWVVVN
jgi:hypothetical protein